MNFMKERICFQTKFLMKEFEDKTFLKNQFAKILKEGVKEYRVF